MHNLEHGGIVMSYRGLTPAELRRLEEFTTSLSKTYTKILVRSYDSFEKGRIGVTAWRWLVLLDQVSESSIGGFIAAYYESDEAPEPTAP